MNRQATDLEKIFANDIPDNRQISKKCEVKVVQSCPALCNPMNYTVHGILQARILEWAAFPFSRGSSHPRDGTQVSCITGGFFTSRATRESQEYWNGQPIPSAADLPDPGIEPRVSCIARGFFTRDLLSCWPWRDTLSLSFPHPSMHPQRLPCVCSWSKYSQAPTLERAWCWQLDIRDGPARAPQHLEAGDIQGGLLEEVMPKQSCGIVRLRVWTWTWNY